MWLIFCIVLLYYCIGLTLIYNLNRGDYEQFDCYERKIVGWAPDRGGVRQDFEHDWREATRIVAMLGLVWPFLIYIYHDEMKGARKKIAEETANRGRSRKVD